MLAKNGLTVEDDEAISARVWNCYETAFCTSVSSQKLLTRRGMKAVHEIGGGSGRQYIVLAMYTGKGCHYLFSIKGETCIKDGMQGGPVSQVGWKQMTSYLGFESCCVTFN